MSLVSEQEVDLQMSVADLPADLAQEVVRLTKRFSQEMQACEKIRMKQVRQEEVHVGH